VVLALDTLNLLQKMVAMMIVILKRGLHSSKFKVQDQKTCKQFRLNLWPHH